jgi:hypothetical protein
MVRSNSGQWKHYGVGETAGPLRGRKKPVHLLKKRTLLHIAPGKRPALERELDETQVANDVIENDRIIEVSPSFIPILRASIEVEITHN